MTIQLYAFDTPNGRTISVALEELGLPCDVHMVDITKVEQFAPAFQAISPNNGFPAILDPNRPGGQSISVFASGAILIYLGDQTGQFWPTEAAAHAATLQWLMFQMGGSGPIPGRMHRFIALDNEDDRRYGLKRFMDEIRHLYAVMDRRLATHQFFAGEISIADFAIVGWAWRHPRHRVDLADYPNVQRSYRTMTAHPGVMRGFAILLRRVA